MMIVLLLVGITGWILFWCQIDWLYVWGFIGILFSFVFCLCLKKYRIDMLNKSLLTVKIFGIYEKRINFWKPYHMKFEQFR